MDWFDQMRNKLFGEPVERSGHLHHGPLERGEGFMQRYQDWLRSNERRDLLAHFREMLTQEQRSADTALHLFANQQATGMQIKRPKGSEPPVLQYLQEEFKNRVLAEGYRMHLADQKISPDGVHRERYYLKPAITGSSTQPPLDQRYGNILVETWGDDAGKPEHLKVMITVYNDRLYSPAESGMALINSLFEDRGRAFN
jgi:hypothetical protein